MQAKLYAIPSSMVLSILFLFYSLSDLKKIVSVYQYHMLSLDDIVEKFDQLLKSFIF